MDKIFEGVPANLRSKNDILVAAGEVFLGEDPPAVPTTRPACV